jgi:acyl-CoA reductase-like NAD-dependent aldehyde dehydrogenase
VSLGGSRVRADSGGYFVEPTVFDGVRPDMRIAREEIFGPVLAALTFSNVVRAGTVYVNCYDADDITVPFGGYKQSGIGRDKSLHAFDKYTELKTTWIELS